MKKASKVSEPTKVKAKIEKLCDKLGIKHIHSCGMTSDEVLNLLKSKETKKLFKDQDKMLKGEK